MCWKVGKVLSNIAELQTVSQCGDKHSACEGKVPPWISTDGTQIRAGLFTVLMERLNRWRSGAFLTICLDAQCNHLIFLVHPRFAGVIFGC